MTQRAILFNSEADAQDAVYAYLQKIDEAKWPDFRIGVLEPDDQKPQF